MASSTSVQGSPNGAATAHPSSPMAAPRLAVLPRRRRAAVVGLGVALVCAGAAVSAAVTLAAGDRVAVLSVVRPVTAGSAVAGADLGEARVASDPGLDPIPVAQRDGVVGQLADVDLRPGTLLTRSQLTSAAIPAAGQAVVGVSLRPGQLPARPLRHGDRVLVVQTPDAAASTADGPAAPSPQARGAVVVGTGQRGADGAVVVDLVVREDDGVALAGAAAAGRLSLVLLPRGG